jgi:galactokinase
VPAERSAAFAPGRVNLIGEHTDYNQGLALPFAIAEGVTVCAQAAASGSPDADRVRAYAAEPQERDEFELASPAPASGWRAFVRGAVAELSSAGFPLVGASLQISGGPPAGAGLSSSAALEVALCLALIELGAKASPERAKVAQLTELAQLCARVENDWVGAHTGLLDQLASLYGAPEKALCIDFQTLSVQPVPLELDGWQLVVLDSGERHLHASSGYNERRAQCARACELLGVSSLREADAATIAQLPAPLQRRASHIIGENERVRQAVAALRASNLPTIGRLLDASHASLRDLYEISTPAVEATVKRLRDAGAAGARLVGGGFGGSVLGLFAPDSQPPTGAREVRPGTGAHLLEPRAL